MEKKEFIAFCRNEFQKQGFKKAKQYFYIVGEDLLCGIDLQKSNYGDIYFVNYFYCIGNYNNSTVLPTYYDSDIQGRVLAMSKTQTDHGKHFLTAMIEYKKYTEDELRPFFDKAFEEKILPPINQGKKYILENLNKLYRLTLNQEDVIRKLQM